MPDSSNLKVAPTRLVEWKTTNKTQNFWLHFSIFGTGSSLTINIYNVTSKTLQSLSQNGISFIDQSNTVASLGSSISGLNKF